MKSSTMFAVLGILTVCSCRANFAAPTAPKAKPAAKPKSADKAKTAMENSNSKPTVPTKETVNLRDLVENSFTVSAPKGWSNMAYSTRVFDVHRMVVTSQSPNSDTVLFIGNPNEPMFWTPEYATEVTYFYTQVSPMHVIAPYQTALVYFPNYAQYKFGQLEGFKIEKVEPNPVYLQEFYRQMHEGGHNYPAEAALVHFSYLDKGKKMSALLSGATSFAGPFWVTAVSGISSAGNASDYFDMLIAMGKSMKTDPQWKAQQQALHEQRMAQLRATTAQIQANTQANAQRHQMRMNAINEAAKTSQYIADSNMKSYNERAESSDRRHHDFMNYINGEQTVVSSDGNAHQVDFRYERYYLDKTDGKTYIGGDQFFDDRAMREMGLDPNKYEEMKLKK